MIDRRLKNIFYPDTGKVVNKEIRLFPDCVFAPTATDILRELPYHYHIGLDEGFMIKEFLWFGDAGYEFNAKSDSLENPAEAAAGAWLKLNDKK